MDKQKKDTLETKKRSEPKSQDAPIEKDKEKAKKKGRWDVQRIDFNCVRKSNIIASSAFIILNCV